MIITIATIEEYKLVKEFGYDNNPVIITGIGGVNVIKALGQLPKNTKIKNIGYAGSSKIPIGTRALVTEVKTLHSVDFEETPMYCKYDYTDYMNTDTRVPCYTSTDFVKETTIEEPCVFDMELAFIKAMFDDVTSIKVISDNLSYEEYKKKVGETK